MGSIKDDLLRNYLARLTADNRLEGFVESAAPLDPGPLAQPKVGKALEKLTLGKPLGPQEQFYIEALIIPRERPAIDIVSGDYKEITHHRWLGWNDERFRAPLRAAFRSVGRIELPGHPLYPYGGTGFVVGDGLLMTNRHVAQLFCSGLGLRGLEFIPGVTAGVDFLRERDNTASQFLPVVKTVMIHPYWDMALLRVDGLHADQVPLLLDTLDPAEHQGKEVAVIGYPAFDPRNNAAVQNELFGGVYGVKRLMPGLLGPRLQVDSVGGSRVSAVGHDASTLGGASGSTVFDPIGGRIIGLHFGGRYLESNYAVPAYELARDNRVIDAGVNFAGKAPGGPAPWDGVWQGREQPAAVTKPTTAPAVNPAAPPPVVTVPLANTGEQTITIPLQISIRLGEAQVSISPQVVANHGPAAAVIQPSVEHQQLLQLCQAYQREGDPGLQRFVINFTGQPPRDDNALGQAISAATGLNGRVSPLFPADPELDAHRLLELPGLTGLPRNERFDLARLLREVTGADTVDPDLGSDYFTDEHNLPDPGTEAFNLTFWCWAGDDEMPKDPDWAIVKTRTPETWKYSEQQGRPSRGEGIRVFQPDTGVVTWHSEIPPGLYNNPGAVNLVELGQPPIDPMTGGNNPGHGTGTSSVVISPEGGKMRGAAPKATLVPIRCLESVAVFDQSRVAQAIDHARRNGAHVITMSLGGVFSDALHTALRKAVEANIIVVSAAGNCVSTVVWPARYDEAIAVAGINERFKPWRGSSNGSSVDISGPAEFVLRANASDRNAPGQVSGGQGTSFATAHLAGVAALWLAHHGREQLIRSLPQGITLQQLFRTLLTSSAQPGKFSKSEKDDYGAGIVDALALLELDPRHAFTQEAVFRTPASNLRSQVVELLSEALGASGIEAAATATGDPQNLLELSCIALDQLRAQRSRRAQLESLPPLALSAGLRRTLGQGALKIAQVGAGDAS
ncbi:S8 family serine peptidase [Pseudomonas putida]|uniref:Serine protease n=1 Tax=Pseudomonas putida TaxID=303 RepID=A0A177S9K1_PSEPU|nr:S8 family serine peptidase [Pseudomonas putida]OAI84708.1 hypothetical protein AYO28_02160 [Pseudomonas putida]